MGHQHETTPPTGVTWLLDPALRHLNHGSFGAVPEVIYHEHADLRRRVEANPVKWFAELPQHIAAARQQMAPLLGVDVNQLAFVLNASAGASVVYASLAHRGPLNVMTTNHGYGAITMGAERLAQRTGGQAVSLEIPLDASADDVVGIVTGGLERARPHLLVIDQVTSATARAFPVDEVCRRARELDVLTLVDGAHSPGVLPEPVTTEADFWVGNLHKFACSPRGAAVLVARDGGALFPSIDSWGHPYPFPERFDHQGTLDLTQWVMAPRAWQYLEGAVGWPAVRERSAALLDEACAVVGQALAGLVEDPVPDVGMPVGPLRLVRLPRGLGETHPAADALRVPFMDATGIVAAFTHFQGRGYLRLSAHLYNQLADYEHLATVGIPLLHQWSTTPAQGTQQLTHH